MERGLCLETLLDFQRSMLTCDFNALLPYAISEGTSSLALPEQPKPSHSYIGLIAMAILSCPDRKMVLAEVYEWITSNYPYFRSRGSGWRNSIRHNLSLNDCFVKAGRAANGKGHYWSIHPANVSDFERGDFRRRRAQRKVRRHMGLSVPPGESSDDSPSPSPLPNNSANTFPFQSVFPLPFVFALTQEKQPNDEETARFFASHNNKDKSDKDRKCNNFSIEFLLRQ